VLKIAALRDVGGLFLVRGLRRGGTRALGGAPSRDREAPRCAAAVPWRTAARVPELNGAAPTPL